MDITLCKAVKCPVKEKCKRYSETQIKDFGKAFRYQSYFTKEPFKIIKGKFNCDMFWGDTADYLFEELKSIMGIKPKIGKNKKS